MTQGEALSKIEKLLALSKSDNVNESAAAAAMAQGMMEKYSITMADVEAGDEEDEEIVVELFGADIKRRSTWQGHLAHVVAESCGCCAIWRKYRGVGMRLVIAGRPSDVEVAVKIRDYCHREIDRLTAKHAAGQGRGWGVSFRLGCCVAIEEAINEERESLREELHGVVSETALVIVDTRHQEARDSLGNLKRAPRTALSNPGAFAAGIVVGQHIYAGTKPRLEG
jgi:hypothetical protein